MGEVINSDFIIDGGTLVEYRGKGGDIVIPSGVKKIGAEVFKENNDIISVDLNEVTEVDYRAFYFCRKLKTVIAKNVKSVGEDSFRFCEMKSIVFGAIEHVGSHAFFGCMYLNEIIGTEHLTEIDEYAFGSVKMTEMTISPNAEKLGVCAFYCCTRLERFTVPSTIKSLSSCVFSGCEGLRSVVLPEGLERIENAAFFGCDRLRYIEIPSTVTFIHTQAFERCRIADICNKSCLEIKQGGGRPGSIGQFAVHVSSPRVGKPTREIIGDFVFCVDEMTDTPYLLEYLGRARELVLPRDFHGKKYKIYKQAFAEANITSLDIGDSVTDIENLAFYKCEHLSSVKFGEGLKVIDRLAFKCCQSLRHVELGCNVEIIGVGAFLGTGLEYIVMDRSVREIRRAVFDYCRPFHAIYYKGSPDELDKIKASGGQSEFFKRIARYYSEDKPTDKEFKYWHYVDGKITEWE
ncbi:MAG: leucine-rich repeat domain-containing protein [Clostridiales bacterium]|nr:leucine-rich repeat domain-containing protein [Clostridiales bacterium]